MTQTLARRPAGCGFLAAAGVGVLLGLGGAEFRLPLLISVFGLAALAVVIVNKAMSLVVVASALPARLAVQDLSALTPYLYRVVVLLAGSMAGAWVGAGWATRLRTSTLYRVLAVLLLAIAIAVVFVAERLGTLAPLGLNGVSQVLTGVPAGFGIWVVAALMGVAGEELLIPTSSSCARSTPRQRAPCRCSCLCPPCSSRCSATAGTRPSRYSPANSASSSPWLWGR